jgi:hypothetical protein
MIIFWMSAVPAVLLRGHEAEQAHLPHALDDPRRILVRVLQRGRDRKDLLVHEVPDRRQHLQLNVGQPFRSRETTH